jgi:hypothetical protein
MKSYKKSKKNKLNVNGEIPDQVLLADYPRENNEKTIDEDVINPQFTRPRFRTYGPDDSEDDGLPKARPRISFHNANGERSLSSFSGVPFGLFEAHVHKNRSTLPPKIIIPRKGGF